MNTTYYCARTPTFTAEYTAYRDRVVQDGGSIASQAACQKAFDFLAANPGYSFDQWLDTRFGVRSDVTAIRWYSILGAAATISNTAYGSPLLASDSILNTPVWARGAFKGGPTPLLAPTESYSIGMRYYQASPGAQGFLFGNRGDDPDPGTTPFGSWWFVAPSYFQYRYYDAFETVLSLPLDVWEWIWLVLDGIAGTMTLYDSHNTIIYQHARTDSWGRNNFGIGGGTDSSGLNDTKLRFQQVVRCKKALTAAERAAFQAI